MKEPYLIYEFRKTAEGIYLTTEMELQDMDIMLAVTFLVRDLYKHTPEHLRPIFRGMMTAMLTAADSPCFDLSMPVGSIVVNKEELRRQMLEEAEE